MTAPTPLASLLSDEGVTPGPWNAYGDNLIAHDSIGEFANFFEMDEGGGACSAQSARAEFCARARNLWPALRAVALAAEEAFQYSEDGRMGREHYARLDAALAALRDAAGEGKK